MDLNMGIKTNCVACDMSLAHSYGKPDDRASVRPKVGTFSGGHVDMRHVLSRLRSTVG
ncbi:hypothetical protein M404DRAFT_890140 [Pisolithus tinctorius Marx 270]|uniref:Uncharacterized protein n=1 Tax=Pisolithus tinctorius Marx 270 TaxID=870435 RepID=A0A0C3NPZ6_PISTI|nr:hypothetical protein M404DRAFT_890140 [Pisolithus tinctorius Marx 270]